MANRTRAAGLPEPPSTPEAPVTRLWALGTYPAEGASEREKLDGEEGPGGPLEGV